MSAPSETTPGNGSDPGALAPSESQGQDPSQGTPDAPVESVDLTDSRESLAAKLTRQTETVRRLQSERDQTRNQVASLEERLQGYGDLTPDQIAASQGAATLGQLVSQHPRGQELVVRLQTAIGQGIPVENVVNEFFGNTQTPTNGPASEDEDLYLSETEKALKEQNKTLTERLERLEQGQGQQAILASQQTVKGHIDTLFQGEFAGMPEDLRTEIFDGVKKAMSNNATLQSRETLQNLTGPNGLESTRILLLSQLTGEKQKRWAKQLLLQEEGRRAAATTDVPSGERTAPDERPAEIPRNVSNQKAVLMALEDAERVHGRLSGGS